MKSLLMIIIGLAISWRYTDIEAGSTFASVIAPGAVFLFLVTLALWVVLFIHNNGMSQTVSSGNIGGSDSSGDGGDF